MTAEQIFSFPKCQMLDDDDFSEFDDMDLGAEEGEEKGFDDDDMIDEEKTDWEEEV